MIYVCMYVFLGCCHVSVLHCLPYNIFLKFFEILPLWEGQCVYVGVGWGTDMIVLNWTLKICLRTVFQLLSIVRCWLSQQ